MYVHEAAALLRRIGPRKHADLISTIEENEEASDTCHSGNMITSRHAYLTDDDTAAYECQGTERKKAIERSGRR